MLEPLPTKTCAACGRTMTWRRSWATTWDQVRYCSERCRRAGAPKGVELELEAVIETLLEQRSTGSTVCPSEAARAVGGEDWRPLMEPARAAARRMVAAGRVDVLQRGRVVDPSTARGPIRIRRARRNVD